MTQPIRNVQQAQPQTKLSPKERMANAKKRQDERSPLREAAQIGIALCAPGLTGLYMSGKVYNGIFNPNTTVEEQSADVYEALTDGTSKMIDGAKHLFNKIF